MAYRIFEKTEGAKREVANFDSAYHAVEYLKTLSSKTGAKRRELVLVDLFDQVLIGPSDLAEITSNH